MAIEIERKFLILPDKLPRLENGTRIEQGYIPTENGTTVRVRLADELAFLCIKSPASSFSRNEYEFAIPQTEATEMLTKVCHSQRVEKYRHRITHNGMLWELDVFLGSNQGLVVAEVELQSEDQTVDLPEWIGEEVTKDGRYSNYALAMNPWCNWH